ncbi:MAG TPA: hypothetical protein VLF62_00410 [Candidatus Saccharimonadales bacterium]|nr:hypothetical protein [Candidatus Saccharimonadales bacterium]
MATAALATCSDFVIWGPSVSSGTLAINAVHALYYLPTRFTLVMPKVRPSEQAAYQKIRRLIRRDGLLGRVKFTDAMVPACRQAIIARTSEDIRSGLIFGHTAEALASAILKADRLNA